MMNIQTIACLNLYKLKCEARRSKCKLLLLRHRRQFQKKMMYLQMTLETNNQFMYNMITFNLNHMSRRMWMKVCNINTYSFFVIISHCYNLNV